jgi:hypothetical protein
MIADMSSLSYYHSNGIFQSIRSSLASSPPLINDTLEQTDVIYGGSSYCPQIPIQLTYLALQRASKTLVTTILTQQETTGWLILKMQNVLKAIPSPNLDLTKRLKIDKYSYLQTLSDKQLYALTHNLLLPNHHLNNPISSLITSTRTMSTAITTLRSLQRTARYGFFSISGHQHDYSATHQPITPAQLLPNFFLKQTSDNNYTNTHINQHRRSLQESNHLTINMNNVAAAGALMNGGSPGPKNVHKNNNSQFVASQGQPGTILGPDGGFLFCNNCVPIHNFSKPNPTSKPNNTDSALNLLSPPNNTQNNIFPRSLSKIPHNFPQCDKFIH